MVLTQAEQFNKYISDAKHILIAMEQNSNGDAIAGSLALKLFLHKLHKQADIVSSDFSLPKKYNFLTESDSIKPTLEYLQKFIIKVDISKSKIDTLSYDIKNNELSIYLTPKSGAISAHDMRTAQSTFRYDLIITLGTEDLNSLGDVFLNNTDLFHRLPIINIDSKPSNEQFGAINMVDPTACSTSEVLFKILHHTKEGMIDATMATSLLTGMISATHSFKTSNVNPTTLKHASELISLGADRENIIKHLYRTKTLPTLKLWGKALSRLKFNVETKLIYSLLTRDDFMQTDAVENDLNGIIEELIGNTPTAELFMLLYEKPDNGKINGILVAEKNYDALALTAQFNSTGNKKQAHFYLTGVTLMEAEKQVTSHLKNNVIEQK